MSAQESPDSPAAEAIEKAETAVAQIVAVSDGERTFDNTIGAIDDLLAQLELDTNMMMFMAYVSTDAAERERGTRAEEDVTNWLIELGKREDLYDAVRAYADSNPDLEGEDARLLEFTLRDYKRAGMELPAEERAQLAAIQKEIARLGIEFEKNIREDETAVFLTREELVGTGDEFIDRLPQSVGLYVVAMDNPTFLRIMDWCENETTRQRVWTAYKRRGGQKNVRILEEIIKLRDQSSDMLGYATYADYETEIKMAKDAGTVREFYAKLRPLVREKAMNDFNELLEAKRAHTGDSRANLWPWDQSFYKQYLLRTKYNVDSEVVRQYFPMERVMDGLFSITQSLYGLEYRDVTAGVAAASDATATGDVRRPAGPESHPLWHEDVRLYEVIDKESGDLIGRFYLDLHPRPNKYTHAAQWGLAQHKEWSNGDVTLPLAGLVCNFTKPTEDKPSLLTHDEVETFFHEFGHCLHTILGETRHWDFAGTGVERDFVEAPSQMFENWVWDAAVLATFARHYETGEPLPQKLLDAMVAARRLASGIEAEHQFYYGLVDFAYHTDEDGEVDTTQVQADLFSDVEIYDSVPHTWFQAGFGHLVGYQAGYYGYQWSLVYAQDMFQRFKELGMLDPEAGRYYREKILSRGGTLDGLDLVRDYLGREPEMDAYLKHLGLEVEED
jgi:thimet oligopeptidase